MKGGGGRARNAKGPFEKMEAREQMQKIQRDVFAKDTDAAILNPGWSKRRSVSSGLLASKPLQASTAKNARSPPPKENHAPANHRSVFFCPVRVRFLRFADFARVQRVEPWAAFQACKLRSPKCTNC
uniref:Uncharacterized protein n=1 Tax=Sphaerodactylus townsendi TaxID=933632 RepID=A0ACB8FSD3_9SAUR